MSEPTAFPLDESKLPFKIPKDTKPREKIMKLGQMITDRVPAKLRRLTVEDPEYWGLASIVTDEMADVALKMKVRQPMTLPELEKATGKPAKELEPLLYQMSCVGLLEYNWENPRREKQYILPMFVPGSAEFFNMNKQQIADHPEVTAFFERMTFLPLEHITAMVPPGGAGIGMHVIPVEKAIETENHSLDIEHISHWLKKYQGKYAAGPCSCRMSRAAMGEGCGDDPDDWCIGVGDMADYLVETNRGHYVTYDEVMRILQESRGQRLCAPDHQHRRREEDLCHLQLQCQRLQRPAHQPAVQHPQHEPLALTWPRWNRKTALPVAAAWSSAPPVPLSWARSCAPKTARCSTPGRNCPIL